MKTAKWGVIFTLTLGLLIPVLARAATITPPPYFYTQKRDDSVKDAVARGRKTFRSMGCVGCHPRGRTIRSAVSDITGVRHPVPVPTLINAADHFPRLSPAGQVVSIGQFNDFCATTFIGNPPMDPYSQKYKDLEAFVVSLSPARYKRMLEWEAKRKGFMKKAQKPSGDASPTGGNLPTPKKPGEVVSGAKNPGAPANPCAPNNSSAPANPCAATNPCAPKNPCAKNPCAK